MRFTDSRLQSLKSRNHNTMRFNHDLLLQQTDQERARQHYGPVFHVLHDPELNSKFVRCDLVANTRKRKSRRAGLIAVGCGTIALLLASTESLYHNLPGAKLLALLAAILGIACPIIGVLGVLYGAHKREWLENRLKTERLRQFHFQSMIQLLPEIARSHTEEGKAAYIERRQKLFVKFWDSFDRPEDTAARLSEVVDLGKEGVERIVSEWTLPQNEQLRDQLPELEQELNSSELGTKLFNAYRDLRIQHQKDYASYKLRKKSASLPPSPRQQKKWLNWLSSACIVSIAAIHLMVIVSLISSMFSNDEMLNLLASKPHLHIIVVVLAIIALSIHALERGLGLGEEIERYRDYQRAMSRALKQLNEAQSISDKIETMAYVERKAFEEMQSFLTWHDEAKYVI